MKRIQELCAKRSAGSYEDERVLGVQLSDLSAALSYPDALGDRVWYFLVKSERVPDLYTKLLQSEGFFDGNPVRFFAAVTL